MRSHWTLAVMVGLHAAQASGHPGDEEAPIEVVVTGERDNQPDTAADFEISRRELLLRPIRAPADVLEAAPGLVVVQHAGGGKANQYFLRGFDADHGTDVALFLNGVPLNARSHGHGQGYADFNFVIPELVELLEIHKGPNDPRFGDFATAGALDVRYLDELPESLALVELGQFGYQRAFAGVSPELGEAWSSLVAVEAAAADGPFEHPEKLRKLNLVASVTRELEHGELEGRLMTYGASWNASGQLPLRAVCDEGEPGFPAPAAFGEPCIDRFGAVDPSEGGHTQRHSAELGWSAREEDTELTALLYAVRYRFGLFSNFTFYATDPVRGDGIEQTDDRATLGGQVRVRHTQRLGSIPLQSSFGVEARADDVDNGLHRQQARTRFATVDAAHIVESSIAAFVEERATLTRWLSLMAALRVERLQADVEPAGVDRAAGSADDMLALPKFGIQVSPAPELTLFGSYGRGFHSNDARSAIEGDSELMAPALGYEAGLRFRPHPDIQTCATAFLLDLSSELVWVGDEGTTEASPESRRMGVELGARAHYNQWLFADVDVTLTRARFVTGDGSADRVPLAPTRTLSAGIGVHPRFGDYRPFGSLRVRAIGDRPANEDGSLIAEGYVVNDVSAGLRYKNIEGALEVMNLFNAKWRPVNFATTSRLPYEPEPVESVHFAPGWPRMLIGRATLYW